MACQCYELLGRYKEGYLLGKSLLQGKLNEEERKDIGHLYALNGYMYACDFIKRDERGRADYRRGRSILEEIKPYAEGEVRNYLLPKIPLTWYFEGTDYFVAQKFEEALKAYYTALAGFQELGKKKDILSTLKAIASTKYHLCDITGADKAYHEALMLARNTEDTSSQMDILQELWYQNYSVGNLEQARLYAESMDSLMENIPCANPRQANIAYFCVCDNSVMVCGNSKACCDYREGDETFIPTILRNDTASPYSIPNDADYWATYSFFCFNFSI